MNPNEPANPEAIAALFSDDTNPAVVVDEIHRLWLDAAASDEPVEIVFSTPIAAKTYRHRMHRWRKNNPNLVSEEIRNMVLSIQDGVKLVAIKAMPSGTPLQWTKKK